MSDTVPKVLLAPNEQIAFDSSLLKYPLFASRKYDGNRNVVVAGEYRSRSMKPQANRGLAAHFKELTDYSLKNKVVFDGELWSPELTFTQLQEVIRSHDKPIPYHVGFYVFDFLSVNDWMGNKSFPYIHRYDGLKNALDLNKFPRVVLVEQEEVKSPDEAKSKYEQYLLENFEGMMLRGKTSKYKHNRATLNEGIIYKFKNFETADAEIISAVEMQKMKASVKDSDRERDVQGHLKRTHKQDDYEPANTLGSLIVRTREGIEVGIGLGKRDAAERKALWEKHKQGKLVGQWVEFSWMPYGSKDKPRIGKLERFRPDLS